MVVAVSGVLQQAGDECVVDAKRVRLLVGRAFPAPALSEVQALFFQGCQMVEDEGVENVLRMFPSRKMDQAIAFFQQAESEQ